MAHFLKKTIWFLISSDQFVLAVGRSEPETSPWYLV